MGLVSARRCAKYLRLFQRVRGVLRLRQIADDAEDLVGRELNHPRLIRPHLAGYLQLVFDGLRLARLGDPAKDRRDDRDRVGRQHFLEGFSQEMIGSGVQPGGGAIVEERAVAILDEHQVGQGLEDRPCLGFARLEGLVRLPPLRLEECALREDGRKIGDRAGIGLERLPEVRGQGVEEWVAALCARHRQRVQKRPGGPSSSEPIEQEDGGEERKKRQGEGHRGGTNLRSEG